MLHLLQSNPWRPVDAWWQRAQGTLADRQPQATVRRDTGRGCGWIKQTQRYLLAMREASTYQDQIHVLAEYPAIYFAHSLHQQQAVHGPPLRSVIEARILARQTDVEIGQLSGCHPEYIEAYEALFFNVRDRLDNRDFILNIVVGQAPTHDAQRRRDQVCKLLGYLGGPHVLDAVITGMPNLAWVQRPEGVTSFFHDLAIGSLRQKAAVASLLASADGSASLDLMKSYLTHIESEQSGSSASSASDQIQDNLQALLESIPLKAIGVPDIKDLPAYEKCAAELRTDELLQMDLGNPVPGLDEIMGLRFPEPASSTQS